MNEGLEDKRVGVLSEWVWMNWWMSDQWVNEIYVSE